MVCISLHGEEEVRVLKCVCQQLEKGEEVIDSFERLMLQGKRV